MFKKKIARGIEINYSHLIMINLIDSVRTSIFYSTIYDIGIYTIHELLHHDLNIEQSSLAKVSYSMSVLVFIVCTFGLVQAFTSLKNISIEKLMSCEKLKKRIEKHMVRDKRHESKLQLFIAKDLLDKEYSYCFG